MPYIHKTARDRIAILGNEIPETAGELNYLFSIIANRYIKKHGLSYSRINDVVGALEGAKLEFYRRVTSGYEDEKIKQNGDVYDASILSR